ncbi:hypothetical protein ABMA28_010081, partial [Loxostege sticticalis]
MFLSRYLGVRTSVWKKRLTEGISSNLLSPLRKYTGITCNIQQDYTCQCQKVKEKVCLPVRNSYFLLENRRFYAKKLEDLTGSQKDQNEKDLKKITQLFPQPRVTLNELTAKTPQKIFEIHYKQNMVPVRKKLAQGDWTCTYSFIWPEKIKFESTAISKRQAAEKAATQALMWLYFNKRVDKEGKPIYDREVIAELRDTVNQPIQICMSEKSMERIDRIWNEYQSGIKPIYEAAFQEAARKSIITPALTKDSTIDEDECTEDEIEMEEIGDFADSKSLHPVYGRKVRPPAESTLQRRDRVLKQKFQLYDEEITPLPIDGYADEITSTLQNSRVVVIVGAAGCGKSTRAPAAILKSCGAKMAAIVSEPRRVAAIGLAQRVASELGEEVGETVGYQVRLHSKPPRPPGGSILYCTSGVLLRRLQTNPGLEGCTHVIIDEAHERDVNTDISLLLLKRALDINPELKIVIMSATLDTEVFIRYFDSCPVIEVPGRTFPVSVSHLDDIQKKYGLNLRNTMENCKKEDSKPFVNCQELVEVIKAVDSKEPEGAILVFLPGWAEIKATKQLLDERYGNSTTHMILPVHSRLSTTEQTKMFATPSPGIRKIVLSTNIAETSITIPDVVYVIDTGAHKENRIKEGTGTASLETVWVSQAAAKQRAGRAGRVQPGHCYRLYTKDKESDFAQHTTPEILRIPLEQTVLDCKTYAPDDKVEDFLSQLPEPPSKKAIEFAVNDLIDLGALTPTEQLTRLGTVISTMTLHPRLACGMLQAATSGSVLAMANIATHCSDNVEIFRDAADRREEIRELKSKYSATSDHAALHWIQGEYEKSLQESGRQETDVWCDKHGLRKDRLNYVKSLSNLHLEQLLKSGFIEPNPDTDELTRFSDIEELSAAMLLSGADSLLSTRRYVKTKGKLTTVTELFTSKGDRAHIGSESVNYGISKRASKTTLLAFFGGQHSIERRALVVYKTSIVPPHTALLFSRGDLDSEVKNDDNETTMISLRKHNLKVELPTSHALQILKAREMWWQTFQYYIDRDLKTLSYDDLVNVSRFKTRLVKAIGRILVEGHREYVLGKSKTFEVDEE